MKIQNNFLIYLFFILFFGLLLGKSNTGFCETADKKPIIIITISGVSTEIKKNIINHLTLFKVRNDRSLTAEQIHLLLVRADAEIQHAVQPFGYYHATIHNQFSPSPPAWQVHFHVNLGKPVIVNNVNIQIQKNWTQAIPVFPLKAGDVLNHESYNKGKQDLSNTVVQQGYLDAQFSEHTIHVNLDENSADIGLVLDTHDLYHVGKFTFSHNPFDEKFLKRFAQFNTGEPFVSDKIIHFQTALQQSDYFQMVTVEPEPNIQTHQVPLDIHLVPLKPNKYQFGLGYGTDTGIRGRAGWERRYLNRYGHRFKLDLHAGQKNDIAKIDADYIIPGYFPNTDQYRLHGGFYNEDIKTDNSKVEELSFHALREISGWQRTISIAYRVERFKDFDTRLEREDRLILPSISLVKVFSDDKFSPTKGHKIGLHLKGAVNTLFSDTTFIQGRIDYKYLRAITHDTKIIARAEVGATFPDDINRIPLTQRFYAGGDNSIRGFGYRALPRDIGGGYLGVGSLEIEQRIKGPLSLAIFTDGGNAFRDSSDKPQLSVGAGFRWHTPIGPIHFDLAKPLTDQAANNWRVHFSFGPEL